MPVQRFLFVLPILLLTTSCAAHRSISGGNGHFCALRGDAPYCWGQNGKGQFGTGTTTASAVPVRAAGKLKLQTIRAGAESTCGIDSKGASYCWGDNANGQLGSGSPKDASVPTPVAGSVVFAKISTGSTGTCALTADGQAYCWGDNGNGQLGQGNYDAPGKCLNGRPCALEPIAVKGDRKYRKIEANGGVRCAITVDTQELYCWGDPQFRQVGTGDTGPQQLPVLVGGGKLAFTSVAIGALAACGVASDGKPYCWGSQKWGELGVSKPAQTCHLSEDYACNPTPVPVDGNLNLMGVDLERGTVCGLDSKGQAYCWGFGERGQLGNGVNLNSYKPVAVSGSVRFRELAVGSGDVCGLSWVGKIYCWGQSYTNVPAALKLK